MYDNNFYDQITQRAIESAREIVPIVLKMVDTPKSVVDFGCGRGSWLSVFEEHGVQDILGLDGDYVNNYLPCLEGDKFKTVDLSQPISLSQKYDLCVTLEVVEHIPSEYEDVFFDSICASSDNILFSGAVPGQGGVNHVNERWHTHWAQKLSARGYYVTGDLRYQIWNNPNIENWYKQNLLFASKGASFGQPPLDLIHPNNWR